MIIAIVAGAVVLAICYLHSLERETQAARHEGLLRDLHLSIELERKVWNEERQILMQAIARKEGVPLVFQEEPLIPSPGHFDGKARLAPPQGVNRGS